MSSSSDRETPKKAVKGRPRKENSCNDFCRVCRCNFKCFYGCLRSKRSRTSRMKSDLFRIRAARKVGLFARLECEKALSHGPISFGSCGNACYAGNFYGDFKRRVSTENLFEISKRAGVEKCRLADLVTELGFSCEKNLAESDIDRHTLSIHHR